MTPAVTATGAVAIDVYGGAALLLRADDGIRRPRDEAAAGVAAAANRVAARLSLPVQLAPDEVEVYDEFIGGGYALPTTAGLDAIRMVARTEGVLLDSVSTGKAMSGLIGLTRRGVFTKEDTVVFIHTGGIPALSAYHRELASSSSRPRRASPTGSSCASGICRASANQDLSAANTVELLRRARGDACRLSQARVARRAAQDRPLRRRAARVRSGRGR
ncbi:MAG: pyridoxal-phosphate dependent enzyme [Chloroflexota bacterium]